VTFSLDGEDPAERLGARASACLFVSPRTGDSTWVAIFDENVKQHGLFNSSSISFRTASASTLANATIIQPSTARAGVRLDPFCDINHITSYCAR
jgi:hypothetical protein